MMPIDLEEKIKQAQKLDRELEEAEKLGNELLDQVGKEGSGGATATAELFGKTEKQKAPDPEQEFEVITVDEQIPEYELEEMMLQVREMVVEEEKLEREIESLKEEVKYQQSVLKTNVNKRR